MRLTDKQKNGLRKKLIHLAGGCDCPPSSKACFYWRIVDQTPEVVVEAIIKEIEKL